MDALCGYYNVDDEDELPTEVQEISLGEMFEAEKSAAEIRAKMVRKYIRNISETVYARYATRA